MQNPIQIFLSLLLSHLIADFPLQFSWIAKQKNCSAWALMAHSAIHFVMSIVLLAIFVNPLLFCARSYLILTILVLTHAATDQLKYWFAKKIVPENGLLFCVDQAIHIFVICVVALALSNTHASEIFGRVAVSEFAKRNFLVIGVVYVGVVFAGGYLIRYLTKSLAQDLHPEGEKSEDLRNAGLYIGWLERFLVLTAIVVQSPTMVGLILTGKSIARFPELKEPRFAEYFLIGTFLSVSFAVMGGLLLAYLLWGTASLK